MDKIKINNLENANQDFTIEIIDFYKEVDKKIINNLINDNETKDIFLDIGTPEMFEKANQN